MRNMLSPIFLLLIHFYANFVQCRYLNYGNDGCSVVVSGSLNSNSVRTVYLGCQQGSLLWTRPEGSMLARFSVADGLNDGKKYRLCIKFIEDHSTQVLVHKMENGVLQNMFDNQQADRLNCLPYDEKHKISIFLKSTFSGGDKNNRYPAGFSYVIEKVEEKEDYAPQCGLCTTQQILKEYCSADFIFHGTLLRTMPDQESLEFSLYGIVRRPVILGNIISAFRPKSSLQTARIFSTCDHEYVNKMAHKEFLVISKTQIGVADLRCAVEYSAFLKIASDSEKDENTSCQLKHKKIDPYSMR